MKKIEDFKIGDKVRIIMTCYPNPKEFFLGKVSIVENIIPEVGCLKLERWGLNVNISFVEKVNINDIDTNMELNESTTFNFKL